MAKSPAYENPQRQAKSPAPRAPTASDRGYLQGIFAPHPRHLPLRRNQENSGTSSEGPRTFPHEAQRDRSDPHQGR